MCLDSACACAEPCSPLVQTFEAKCPNSTRFFGDGRLNLEGPMTCSLLGCKKETTGGASEKGNCSMESQGPQCCILLLQRSKEAWRLGICEMFRFGSPWMCQISSSASLQGSRVPLMQNAACWWLPGVLVNISCGALLPCRGASAST